MKNRSQVRYTIPYGIEKIINKITTKIVHCYTEKIQSKILENRRSIHKSVMSYVSRPMILCH